MKNSQEIKTKSQTATVKNTIISVILVLGGVIVFTSPFWHIDFPRKTEHIAEFEKTLHKEESLVSEKQDALRKNYDQGLLTAEKYIIQNDVLTNELEQLKARNSVLLKEEVDKNRIFVWKNTRAFLLGFGIRLPYVFFAIIFSVLISLITSKDIRLKRAFFLLQSFNYGIATYLMIWVFWTSQDFPLGVYRYAFITTSLLVGTSISYFLIWKKHKVARLEAIIRRLFDFIIIESKENGFIKDEKENSYDKKGEELVFEALDNE